MYQKLQTNLNLAAIKEETLKMIRDIELSQSHKENK